MKLIIDCCVMVGLFSAVFFCFLFLCCSWSGLLLCACFLFRVDSVVFTFFKVLLGLFVVFVNFLLRLCLGIISFVSRVYVGVLLDTDSVRASISCGMGVGVCTVKCLLSYTTHVFVQFGLFSLNISVFVVIFTVCGVISSSSSMFPKPP